MKIYQDKVKEVWLKKQNYKVNPTQSYLTDERDIEFLVRNSN